MQYFFVLGHNPTLSVAEIISVLSSWKLKFHIHKLSEEFLILEIKKELDFKRLQEKLGGTIKIGKVILQINANLNINNTKLVHEIFDLLLKISKKSRNVFFGFSLYNSVDRFRIENLWSKIKNLALTIKKELKEKNISSRWVTSKEKKLSSVIVQKNKLLTQGAEFCFFITRGVNANQNKSIHINLGNNYQKSTYIGITLSCQKFEEYSQRDYGRPRRKIEEGMIPPKLAKIMINLSQAQEKMTILDPFCGSGTILQEALLMGYRNIIGTDISQEAVKNTKDNLKWLAKNFQLSISSFQTNFNIQIFQADVKNISQKIPNNSVDVIVTEPYLGPIKISNFQSSIFNLIKDLDKLYLTAFCGFKKVLKENGRIVIVFPVFKIKRKLHFLPILDQLKKSGWQIINPIPSELKNNPIIKITNRNSIIYSRPDQKVLREIFVFKPTNYE